MYYKWLVVYEEGEYQEVEAENFDDLFYKTENSERIVSVTRVGVS